MQGRGEGAREETRHDVRQEVGRGQGGEERYKRGKGRRDEIQRDDVQGRQCTRETRGERGQGARETREERRDKTRYNRDKAQGRQDERQGAREMRHKGR
jgi:hypothetical protein